MIIIGWIKGLIGRDLEKLCSFYILIYSIVDYIINYLYVLNDINNILFISNMS